MPSDHITLTLERDQAREVVNCWEGDETCPAAEEGIAKLRRALDTPPPEDLYPDLDLDAIRKRVKELAECESDAEAIRMVTGDRNLVGIVGLDSPGEPEGEPNTRLREALFGQDAIEAGAEAAHKLFGVVDWSEVAPEAQSNNRRAVRKALAAAWDTATGHSFDLSTQPVEQGGSCDGSGRIERPAPHHGTEEDDWIACVGCPMCQPAQGAREDWPEVWCAAPTGFPEIKPFVIYDDPQVHVANGYQVRRYVPAPEQRTYTVEEVKEALLGKDGPVDRFGTDVMLALDKIGDADSKAEEAERLLIEFIEARLAAAFDQGEGDRG